MEKLTRRDLLKNVGVMTGGAAVLGITGLPATADGTPAPAPAPAAPIKWVDAGPLPAMKVGDVQRIVLPDSAFKAVIYLRRATDKDYAALSARCTHRGCTVGYDATSTDFNCPCHGAQFDQMGQVLRGPAKQPLSPLSVKIDDKNELWVSMPPMAGLLAQ